MKLPVVPTALVALAVAAMVALGVWQIQRRGEKLAEIATYRANLTAPPVAFPAIGPVPQRLFFRRSSVTCLRVAGWDVTGGHDVRGNSGEAHIARCVTGAEGPGARVLIGVDMRPQQVPTFAGGRISGWIAPARPSLLDRITGAPPPDPTLIADHAVAPGLARPAPPDPDAVPNNHLLYAVQWFGFAMTALVIYALALRRRIQDGR